MRRIASHYLWTPRGFIKNPVIEADAEGRIVAVTSAADRTAIDAMSATEFYAGILTPGWVNAHCHLELSCLRGAIPAGGGFAAFARAMGSVRGRFSDEERQRAIEAADAAMWRDGVQAVGDIVNGEASFAVKRRSPIRYRSFAELFGLRTASTEPLRPLLAHPDTSLTPHSIYSVPDALFREIAAEGDAPLSIHFHESPAEAELFARRGALWEWYRQAGFACDFLHYGSPARRIVASVPADRPVLLIHNCCVTPEEIEIILNHFTAPVWWVLCPGSNRYISELRPPVELLRSYGARICVGTDSLASNERLSLPEELRAFADVPLEELLGWVTRNGAEALGWGDELGEVVPGRRCGLTLLTGLDYPALRLTAASRLERIL